MKCEKCGREANYFYSANINGTVTEHSLCAQCAGGEQPGAEFFARMGDLSGLMESFFGGQRAAPAFGGLGFAIPVLIVPGLGTRRAPETEPETAEQAPPRVEADPELQKRREANILREQMCKAAEREDFEKAAELRDRLREMEK